MKASIVALLLPAVSGRFVQNTDASHVQLHPEVADAEKFHIELAPGKTRWVTEEEKWELRRNGQRFFDITATPDLGHSLRSQSKKPDAVFPSKLSQQDAVNPLLKKLSTEPMKAHLEKFTSFHTRYYKSEYGRQSSQWLLSEVNKTIADAGAHQYGVRVEHFEHSWGQNSVIATIPGRSQSTIVVGAHQDSINLFLPSILAAPGADDDGSGTVTTLEALRVLLSSGDLAQGKLQNTVEFHWYSAEEGGLLGSQAIFSTYETQKRVVKAMLQQDMTGFIQRTIDAGKPESVGVIVDYVNPALTEFIKKVIDEYCDIPYVETECGYACSDHASASKAGYPSAFVIESSFDLSDNHIHTTDDQIKYLSFDHMLQHAKMTTAFVYELASTDFEKLEKKSEEMSEL